MRRVCVFILVFLILAVSFPAFAEIQKTIIIQEPPDEGAYLTLYPKRVKQTLHLKKRLDSKQMLKLLEIFDEFELHALQINNYKRTIFLDYDPREITLGTILTTLKGLGCRVLRIE